MSEHTVCSSCRIDGTCPNDPAEPTAPCPVCTGHVPLVDGKLIVHRHRDQFGPCPAGQVEPIAGVELERAKRAEFHRSSAPEYYAEKLAIAEEGLANVRDHGTPADTVYHRMDCAVILAELARIRVDNDRMRAELTKTVADCGICTLGGRWIHVNDDCPRHGDTDGESW